MARPPKFDEEQFLAAAGRLIATHGPARATIGAIGRAVGAPTGSIYHRFDSRDGLLAEVCLRGFVAWAGSSLLVGAALDDHRLRPGQDYGAGLVGNLLGYPGPDVAPVKPPGC